MIFGDPERKRREKRQEDLDSDYYKRRKAYKDAKEEQRLKNAREAGIRDANKLANRKPFYQKLIGAGVSLGKDVIQGAAKTNPDVFFSWDTPKPKRKRRKKKRR
jgi:hypothetical protein